MKRLIAAAVLMLILISFCTVGIIQILGHEDKIIGMISQAVEAAENDDFDKAYEIDVQSEEEWIKSEQMLAPFTSHLHLDDVGLAISKLPPLIKYGNKAQFISECKYTIVQIKHLADSEIPALTNIF